MFRRRSFFAACTVMALGAASLAACGADEGEMLGVEVSFDTDLSSTTRDATVRVEAYLVAGCNAVSMGERPRDAIASTHALRDQGAGQFFGPIAFGDYGLYAVAQDTNCMVVAAGCTPVTIDSQTQGPLSVIVSAFSGTGCSGGEQCLVDNGECSEVGGKIVNNCGPEPDLVACRLMGRIGLCRSGECCTGYWDGRICQDR